MQGTRCLNCGNALFPGQKFCPGCGQSVNIKRLNGWQLLINFGRLFIRAETGIVRLIKGLTLNPGKTAARYVEGERKKYYNPFFFAAICVALMLLINNWVKPYETLPEPDPVVLARIPDQETKELYILSVRRTASIQNFVNNNLKAINIIIAPWFAFFLWLFFRKRGRNLSEIIVVYVMFSAFINLLTAIAASPILAYFKGEKPYYYILFANLAIQTVYIAWGMNVFFNFRSASQFFKMLAALSLIGLVGFILVMIAWFFYIYNGAFGIFRYL